ncbi:MAG: HAD-IB family phosphatase [Desulfurococcales archaeon]|nr:HAD-IB family phosphatase [Desulfurococcales archaeon]
MGRSGCVRLVVFDMDGVLVDVHSSWEYLHKKFGVEERARAYKRLFEEGRISYEDWMRLDVSLWIEARGRVHKSELEALLAPIRPRSDAVETVRSLRGLGVYMSIVSGGIDLLARRIARELGIGEWRANILSFDEEGYLQPGGDPLVGVDKSRAVKEVAEKFGVALEETMFVGDSKWDLPALRIVGHPVLFLNEKTGHREGSEDLLRTARHVISSLREIVGIVKNSCKPG